MLKKSTKSEISTIHYGSGSLKKLNNFLSKKTFTQLVILTDAEVLKNCYPLLLKNVPNIQSAEIIELEGGEQNKNINTVIQVWETLTDLGTDKYSLLINFGGGVVTDLGGFAASVYKRGIPFIHIPTSLMAMADAAIGGKCGVDLNNIKNHVGNITQPLGIYIFPDFLNSLPSRHLKNGMAEVIKAALIKNKSLFHVLRNKSNTLEYVLQKAIGIKKEIVSKDPNEKNIRKILNFGHSMGHAIESTFLNSSKELLHGEAVAIGMLMEACLSYQKKMLTKSELNSIESLIVPTYNLVSFTNSEKAAILKYLQHDKKNEGKKIRMSLLKGIGNCKTDVVVDISEINRAFIYYQTVSKK